MKWMIFETDKQFFFQENYWDNFLKEHKLRELEV